MDCVSNDALTSLLWTLSLHDLPPHDDPRTLPRLTPRNIVLALLAAALQNVLGMAVNFYVLGYQATQGCACACVTAAGASRQLKPAYLAYLHTLNRDNSAAATTIKLCQSWLAVSTLWRLLQLLRVNLLLGWLWRNMLWPLLLGLVWRPRIVTTVLSSALMTACCSVWLDPQLHPTDPVFSKLPFFISMQVLILVMGGGWLTVAALLLAATFHLPRLPKHPLWPHMDNYISAVMSAASFLAPLWP
ncbi:hypothetical protein OEZ86_012929 [Tetradesmus obliquus]|nr:hypothetical protein OEZ86_012929 [Tetradesmus obliquus]